MKMKYVNKLLAHPEFVRIQDEIKNWERERIYCHHEMEHVLDVCRIAWVMYLEAHAREAMEDAVLQEMKERFYIAGLLHDIGRACQYETGEHHSAAGSVIAKRILAEIGYPEAWSGEAVQIVGAHHGRTEFDGDCDSIGYYIQKADHLSRNCFLCDAADSCKWKKQERNETITY